MNELNRSIPPQFEAPNSGGNDAGRAEMSGRTEIAAAVVQYLSEFEAKVKAIKQDDSKTQVAELNVLLAELPDIRIFAAQITDGSVNPDQLVTQLKRELLLLRNNVARREFTVLVADAPQKKFKDIQAGIKQYVTSVSFSENVAVGTPEFEERNKIFLYSKFGLNRFITAAFRQVEDPSIVMQIKKFDAPIATRYEETYKLVRVFVAELYPPTGYVLNYGDVRTALENLIAQMGSPLVINGKEIDLQGFMLKLPVASSNGLVNELAAYGAVIGSLKVAVHFEGSTTGAMQAEAEKLPDVTTVTEQPDKQEQADKMLLAKYTKIVFPSSFDNVTWEQYTNAWNALRNWQQTGLSVEPVFRSKTSVSAQLKERTATELAAQVDDFQAQITAVTAASTLNEKKVILQTLQRRLLRQGVQPYFSGMIEAGLVVFLERVTEEVINSARVGATAAEVKRAPTNRELREKYGGRINPDLHYNPKQAETYYSQDLAASLANLERLHQNIPEVVNPEEIGRYTNQILETLGQLAEVGYVFQLTTKPNGKEIVFEISAADLRTRLAEVIREMPSNTRTEAARNSIAFLHIRKRVPTVGNVPQLLARIYGVQDLVGDLDNHQNNIFMVAANQKQTPAQEVPSTQDNKGFFKRLFGG